MSLVNDVLKDLNRRTQQADNAIPIQALQIDTADKPKFLIRLNLRKVLLMIGALLALIVVVQLITNKPLSQYFSEPDYIVMAPASNDKIIEVKKNVIVAEEEKPVSAKNQIAAQKEKKEVVENALSPDSKTVISDADNIQTQASEAEVLKVKVPGLTEYHLALKAYKEKQFPLAMNWVDTALSEQEKTDYLLLKARIYIHSKDAAGLYEYVLDHSDLANIEWFKLVAPGLQMFGYHQLSNKYYSALVTKYPEQIKYHLAMALNFSRLGEYDKTYQIYQDLSLSQQMTKKQKRWLTAQLSRLDSKKAQHGS